MRSVVVEVPVVMRDKVNQPLLPFRAERWEAIGEKRDGNRWTMLVRVYGTERQIARVKERARDPRYDRAMRRRDRIARRAAAWRSRT